MNKTFINLLNQYRQRYFEWLFWTTALVLLFMMHPDIETPTLCIFRWLNINHCPGCGLGHSMHYAMHLQFAASFKHHPMGIVAVLIILNRIKQLSFKPKYIIQ